MPKTNQPAAHSEPAPPSTALLPVPHTTAESSAMTSKLATVAAVGVGAALLEVELLPGMLLGVAAMLVPDLLPRLGSGIRPLVKGAVRAGYAATERTKETVAGASEQFQDIVAEVRSEQNQPQTSQATASSSGQASQPA